MKEVLFSGSACALVTPFDPEEKEVDLSKYEDLCRFQLENGTQALVVCGTTGEAATLSYEERSLCISTAVRCCDGKIPVIAGTGSNNTETAVRLSNDAEKEGVDGLLIVTPFYNKASQEGIVAHYGYIAQRVSCPIIVYNVPSRTGVDIKPETYKALSEIKNIVGIKEANGNISSVIQTVSVCDLTLYSGNDEQTVPMMSVGAKGVISVAANIIPQTMQELTRLCEEQEYRQAADLQTRLTELEKILFSDINPIPIKTMMHCLKLCDASVRLPLTPCRDALRQKITEIAKHLNMK